MIIGTSAESAVTKRNDRKTWKSILMPNKSYKGRKFEIALSKELSLWWTGGVRDDVFWHTHDSGGRATRRARRGVQTVNHYGDICATDPVGQPLLDLCVIEAKKGYNGFTLQDMIDQPPPRADKKPAVPIYLQWFAQAAESARHASSKGWMIIARRDKRAAFVIMDAGTWAALVGSDSGVNLYDFTPRLTIYGPGGAEHDQFAIMISLAQFLTKFTPDMVRKAVGTCTAP